MKSNADIKVELSQISTLIENIEVKINYSAPTGYFNTLTDIIKQKIKHQNNTIDNIFDSTDYLNKSELKNKTFVAPENYFSSLPNNILDKVSDRIKTKHYFGGRLLFSYSMAAVIIILIGLILFYNLPHKFVLTNDKSNNLVITNETKKINLNENIDEELDKINELDALEYLKENGHDINAALVASLTENSGMPDEVDYLYDNETLNNYIDKIK